MGAFTSQPKTRWCIYTNLTTEAELKQVLQENDIHYDKILVCKTIAQPGIAFCGHYTPAELARIKTLGIKLSSN